MIKKEEKTENKTDFFILMKYKNIFQEKHI